MGVWMGGASLVAAHTTPISDAPPCRFPGARRERVANGEGQERTRAQKNPEAPCPRVNVPASAYRVRATGGRRNGVDGRCRWRQKGEGAAPHRVTRELLPNGMEQTSALSFPGARPGVRAEMPGFGCCTDGTPHPPQTTCVLVVDGPTALRDDRIAAPLRLHENVSSHPYCARWRAHGSHTTWFGPFLLGRCPGR